MFNTYSFNTRLFRIQEQEKHYGDDSLVKFLKKKKLKLKDEIQGFKSQLQ
jgi:hypothetical protein